MSHQDAKNLLEEIMAEAFQMSTYLHSVGSGDYQAIGMVADDLLSIFDDHEGLDLWEVVDEEVEAHAALAGLIAGRALIRYRDAYDLVSSRFDEVMEELHD